MRAVDVAEQIRSMLDDVEVPILHDNAPPIDTTPAYIRARVTFGERYRASAGVSRYRTEGVAEIELYVALTKGDNHSLTLAQQIIDVFTDARVPDLLLRFRVASITGAPEVVDHWFRRTVSIPFLFDEVVA
jgi:hypothetical protein